MNERLPSERWSELRKVLGSHCCNLESKAEVIIFSGFAELNFFGGLVISGELGWEVPWARIQRSNASMEICLKGVICLEALFGCFSVNIVRACFALRCTNMTWKRRNLIDQVSARMVEVCSVRSRMLRCSSAPSTSRLSTSEKIMKILHFFLFGMVSS